MLWRRDIDAPPYPPDVVLDGAGDIFIPTAARDATGDRFAVMKLSGARGEPLWTASVGSGALRYQIALRAALVPSGGIAAVGITTDEAGVPALAAVLLDAETGAERWHRLLRGNDGYGIGRDLAVMPDGDVVVGGQLRNRHSCYDLSFARLAAATGEVRELRSLDGTTTAPVCDADCLDGFCRTPPRAGFDQDSLSSLALDDDGRIVVAGVVSDGHQGRLRGIVAALPVRGGRKTSLPRSALQP
jgi:outer membrane protein assembly factor BamB